MKNLDMYRLNKINLGLSVANMDAISRDDNLDSIQVLIVVHEIKEIIKASQELNKTIKVDIKHINHNEYFSFVVLPHGEQNKGVVKVTCTRTFDDGEICYNSSQYSITVNDMSRWIDLLSVLTSLRIYCQGLVTKFKKIVIKQIQKLSSDLCQYSVTLKNGIRYLINNNLIVKEPQLFMEQIRDIDFFQVSELLEVKSRLKYNANKRQFNDMLTDLNTASIFGRNENNFYRLYNYNEKCKNCLTYCKKYHKCLKYKPATKKYQDKIVGYCPLDMFKYSNKRMNQICLIMLEYICENDI